ncbi:MAG TPA: HPr family phosphocarrier protein [Actinomycetota bacterium]|nr:HPr family phosphocarrier protein [Actinomycetota bacterium]
MPERNVTLENEVGLHARPAAVFSKAAARFSSSVTVVKSGAEGNAKSVLSVLKLDIQKGDSVTIRADGPDEEEALTELVKLVEDL